MKTEVFLNGRFLTQPITGVQRCAYEIVLALDKLLNTGEINGGNYRFTLIYSGMLINPIELKSIHLVKRGVLSGNLWEQFELPLYTAGKLLISMCTVSSLLKRKQVVFVHDASFLVNPQYFSPVFRTWYKFAITWLGKVARQIVTVSDFSKRELVKFAGFDPARVTVIPNAAEHILKFDDPPAIFKDKINALKPYCLAVSSQSANKNFNGLTRAIKKIDFKKFNVLIAGGVISTLQYQAPGPSVTYLGYVSNEELKYLYLNATLFIFPSFYEGFGIPPLEAMIAGCPVLASATSSLPEVLGDACEYFNPADSDSMAAAIDSLINDENTLADFKERGYIQAKKYSWKNSALQLITLIGRID